MFWAVQDRQAGYEPVRNVDVTNWPRASAIALTSPPKQHYSDSNDLEQQPQVKIFQYELEE
jgi:hypothetical protein